MTYPTHRPRRLRRTAALRRLVREVRLDTADLVYPLFVAPGQGVREEIGSLPGNYHWSVDRVLYEVERAAGLGLRALILFGLPGRKDPEGSEAWHAEGTVQRSVREIKARFPEMLVTTDVCLCQYTDHGHCGILDGERVDNDATLERLARTAVSHAAAGADLVAPSDMMDGRVGAIRSALDAAGLEETGILSYAAKYASAYYGPFREAAHSTPSFGDRRSYQMDPANAVEAIREVALDLQEGADMVIVKPALAYLDVVRRVKEAFDVPVAAYNVSGEFSLVKAAAARGWIDERAVVMETLTGIRRAGADFILTYHAPDAARWLQEEET